MDSLNTDNNDDSNRLDSKPAANDDDGSDASSSGGNTGSADDDNVKSSAQPQHEINDSSLAVSLTANPTNDAMSSENARPPQALLTKFPARLHRMLNGVEKDGLDHIVSWRPHGRCFGVNKAKDFVKRILPLYFRQTKITSFQRQLNIYGFKRITTGRDRNCYYHKLFIKGMDGLASQIQRVGVKGSIARMPLALHIDPNFYDEQLASSPTTGTGMFGGSRNIIFNQEETKTISDTLTHLDSLRQTASESLINLPQQQEESKTLSGELMSSGSMRHALSEASALDARLDLHPYLRMIPDNSQLSRAYLAQTNEQNQLRQALSQAAARTAGAGTSSQSLFASSPLFPQPQATGYDQLGFPFSTITRSTIDSLLSSQSLSERRLASENFASSRNMNQLNASSLQQSQHQRLQTLLNSSFPQGNVDAFADIVASLSAASRQSILDADTRFGYPPSYSATSSTENIRNPFSRNDDVQSLANLDLERIQLLLNPSTSAAASLRSNVSQQQQSQRNLEILQDITATQRNIQLQDLARRQVLIDNLIRNRNEQSLRSVFDQQLASIQRVNPDLDRGISAVQAQALELILGANRPSALDASGLSSNVTPTNAVVWNPAAANSSRRTEQHDNAHPSTESSDNGPARHEPT